MTTACLIIIGNEILSGRTQDKNLSYLAEKLNSVGVRLMEARVIPDIEDTIIATVNECRAKFEYIFTTGGIGPTHDDITAAAIAKAFGVPIRRSAEAEKLMRDRYEHLGVEMNDARLKMADLPEGASLILNDETAAPGFKIGNVHVMAGVPKIMQSMLEGILPTLKGSAPMHSVSLTTNLPEGTIAAGLTNIQNDFPDVEIGSYPHFADKRNYTTTLVSRSQSEQQANEASRVIEELIAGLGGKLLD